MIDLSVCRVADLEKLLIWREEERRCGRKVVLTNGCFDLLHRGHIEYLQSSALLGDSLIVAINSDESVKALKGSSRPINLELDRAFAVASLRVVTATFVFQGPRLADEIRQLKPDVYTKAGDYSLETLEPTERQALQDSGADVVIIPFSTGYSTTSTLLKTQQ
jgi:D-glycero-beta-D-manno-heptose 1-phosphate adenylyltransferase